MRRLTHCRAIGRDVGAASAFACGAAAMDALSRDGVRPAPQLGSGWSEHYGAVEFYRKVGQSTRVGFVPFGRGTWKALRLMATIE